MTKKSNKRKLPVLMFALVFAASSIMAASASDITGISGANGTFNIDPAKSIGNTGFRNYTNFTLDSGDVANLNYTGINKFVNMVDNRININGIVNTVKNGDFYNGNAVFMSPKGMVVGSGGVMNVGSLSVYTPTATGMQMLRAGVNTGNLTTQYKGEQVNLLEAMGWHGNAPVTINGRILSGGDVDVVANTFNVGTGFVGAGLDVTQKVTPQNSDTVFNELVNAGVSGRAANVNIRSYDRSAGNTNDPVGGINITGRILNKGNGDITITNRGTNGLVVNTRGDIYSENGAVKLVNGKGAMNVNGLVGSKGDSVQLTNGINGGAMTVGGTITGNNGTRLYNRSASGMTVGGTINNSNNGLAITNEQGELQLNGTINNSAAMNVTSKGTGLVVNGNINSSGAMQMSNSGTNGITINGKINNSKSTAITNVNGNFVVADGARITMSDGKLNLTNKGKALKVNGIVQGSGKEVLIQNVGTDGFEMNGTVENEGSLFLQNTNGAMTVNGSVLGSDATGNGKDHIYIGNSGSSLTLGQDSKVLANGNIQLANSGNGGMLVKGEIQNYHTSKDVTSTTLMNTKGNLTVDGSVHNASGNINLTNKGNKLTISESGTLGTDNGELTVQNTGAGGMNIDGKVMSKGAAYVYNKAGNLNVNGLLLEEGELYVTNAGNALNVNENATVKAAGIGAKVNMLNEGNGGMKIAGLVTDTGRTIITNQKGDLNITGAVSNKNGMLQVTNHGNELNIAENASVTNDTNRTYVTNTGAGGMDIDGTVTTKGHSIVTNRAGGMNVDGNVTSTMANTVVTNTGNQNTVIDGTVRANKVTVHASGNDIVLGNTNTEQIAVNGLNKVSITNDNGSIKNAGVETHIVRSGGNLYMEATNGSIGEDVDTSGIGIDSRDLTKSVNVFVNGRIKAFTTDANKNSVINIASKGKNLRIDRVKADGKAILTADRDDFGNGGSILNRGTELDQYANVKGTTVHMISSGSIGTKDKPIHFRQTDATQDSNVLAVKNIYLHARGEDSGEDVKFGTIKSKTGSIEADMIRNGQIENAIAPKAINITARKNNAHLKIQNSTHDANVIKDYFDY